MTRRKVPSFETRRKLKQRSPYHSICYQFLESVLPARFRLTPEYMLYKEPQRIDLLVICQDVLLPALPDEDLPSLVSHLGKTTLLEFKGPTDILAPEDVNRLLGYACQYAVMEKTPQEELRLGFLASTVPAGVVSRVKQLKGELKEVSHGVWEGSLCSSPLFALETSKIWKKEQGERLWCVLSPAFLETPWLINDLTKEQVMLYYAMVERLEIHAKEEPMALRNFEELNARLEKAKQEFMSKATLEDYIQTLGLATVLSRIPVEVRMQDVPVEVRMRDVPVEVRMRDIPHEVRMQDVPVEVRMRDIPPEVRMQDVPLELRLKSIPPEQLVALLPPEALALLRKQQS
ncbi:MAG: hypothetical protein ACKO6N_25570 [Myxococcota bacterium]